MRVIAGHHRSRTLHAPHGMMTRPTHDRVREALFSMLGPMTELRVLDLCAGTGALGIEALSRGAKHAVFVERAKEALDCLTRNVRELELTAQSSVVAQSVSASQARMLAMGPYDFIFCDPPWAKLDEVLREIERAKVTSLLTPSGTFVLEHSSKDDIASNRLPPLAKIKTRRWGDTAVTLFGIAEIEEQSLPETSAEAPL